MQLPEARAPLEGKDWRRFLAVLKDPAAMMVYVPALALKSLGWERS